MLSCLDNFEVSVKGLDSVSISNIGDIDFVCSLWIDEKSITGDGESGEVTTLFASLHREPTLEEANSILWSLGLMMDVEFIDMDGETRWMKLTTQN
jgi:hypothetical protein